MLKWPCPHCGEEVEDYDGDGLGWCITKCGFVAQTKEIFDAWYADLHITARPILGFEDRPDG